MEATDIGIPPGDAAQGHGQPADNALSKRVKGGWNISVPDADSKTLTSDPGCTGQSYRFLLPRFPQTIIEGLCIVKRVQKRHLPAVSRAEPQIFQLPGMYLRLRLIQPKGTDTLFIIISFYLFPYKTSGCRIRGIDKSLLPIKIKHAVLTLLICNQHIALTHFPVILALRVNGRPDGHHRLNPHLLKLPAHLLRLRPTGRIKFPIPLFGPVEIIYHNRIDGNSSSFIFPGHGKQLVLTLVAQLTLPEAQRPFRQPWRITCQLTVRAHQLLRRISGKNQIIDLISLLRIPERMIVYCFAPPRRRIIPDKTISQ